MKARTTHASKLPKRAPFRATRLDHLVILVDDLSAAERFYVETVGCRIAVRVPNLSMIELKAGSFALDLVDVSQARGAWARADVSGGKNMDHFCLAVHGCTEAALRHHLSARGAMIQSERREQTPAGEELSIYVRDPSGNLVELLLRS